MKNRKICSLRVLIMNLLNLHWAHIALTRFYNEKSRKRKKKMRNNDYKLHWKGNLVTTYQQDLTPAMIFLKLEAAKSRVRTVSCVSLQYQRYWKQVIHQSTVTILTSSLLLAVHKQGWVRKLNLRALMVGYAKERNDLWVPLTKKAIKRRKRRRIHPLIVGRKASFDRCSSVQFKKKY